MAVGTLQWLCVWNTLTVTKMWQKIGHIVRRSVRNLTKCWTINTKFTYLVKLRRLRRAMCPIFSHILVTVSRPVRLRTGLTIIDDWNKQTKYFRPSKTYIWLLLFWCFQNHFLGRSIYQSCENRIVCSSKNITFTLHSLSTSKFESIIGLVKHVTVKPLFTVPSFYLYWAYSFSRISASGITVNQCKVRFSSPCPSNLHLPCESDFLRKAR